MPGKSLRHVLLILVIGAFVAACGNAPSASVPPVSPTAVSPAATQAPAIASPVATTAPAVASPVATATAAATPAPTAVATLERGRTPEGYHYLGSADAPITLQEYSDFF